LDDDMDVLLLRALRQMVDFAEGFKLSQADWWMYSSRSTACHCIIPPSKEALFTPGIYTWLLWSNHHDQITLQLWSSASTSFLISNWKYILNFIQILRLNYNCLYCTLWEWSVKVCKCW
jgi:hypothetical protein